MRPEQYDCTCIDHCRHGHRALIPIEILMDMPKQHILRK